LKTLSFSFRLIYHESLGLKKEIRGRIAFDWRRLRFWSMPWKRDDFGKASPMIFHWADAGIR